MSSLQHELKISASRSQIIEALTTGAHLERWHGARVSESSGTLKFVYPSGVVFRWQVTEAGPDRVTWKCIEGPGNSVGTQAMFAMKDAGHGRTAVAFEHAGWSETDPSLRKCNTLWGALLHQLQQHLAPTDNHTAKL